MYTKYPLRCTPRKNHFKDIDEIASKLNLYNRKKNTNNEKVYFRDGIKWIRVDTYGCYNYKTTLDENTPFYQVDILKKTRVREINPDDITLRIFNENRGSISAEKLANLKEQLPFIKEEYRQYSAQNRQKAVSDNFSKMTFLWIAQKQ